MEQPSPLRSLRAALLVTALVGSACSSQSGGSAAPSRGATATTTAEATSVAVTAFTSFAETPRPTALATAPPELIVRWRAAVGQGEIVILTITAAGYATGGGFGPASGSITVEGDVITFLKSDQCDGMGAYRWSIDGDSLHLESIGPDDCLGRAHALADQTHTRVK
jgi:hypothetical protein